MTISDILARLCSSNWYSLGWQTAIGNWIHIHLWATWNCIFADAWVKMICFDVLIVKLYSHDPTLSDPVNFRRMECSFLLIKQYCIGFSWLAAHTHCSSKDYKTSIGNELDPTKLNRVNIHLQYVFLQVGQSTDADIAYISPAGKVFLHVSAVGSKRLEELNRDLTEHYRSKVNCIYIYCSS